MNKEDIVKVFEHIAFCFKSVLQNEKSMNFPGYKQIFYHNPWFTEEFVKQNLNYWANTLNRNNILNWLNKYPELISSTENNKKLGLIFAGNVPMVGLHDFLSGIACNYKLIIKPSDKDKLLINWLVNQVKQEFDYYNDRIQITQEVLKDFDLIIATGSNNTYRYFEYYFAKYPNILRKNKNSIGIISGEEDLSELKLFAKDIFSYFGLGCRSLSKIYVPDNYCFKNFIESFKDYSHLINHNKYVNNYDYQNALLQLNKIKFINAGNILLVENSNISSPIGVLHYEYYKTKSNLISNINNNIDNIQCIVSSIKLNLGEINPGEAQNPELNEYADNIDTINFLISKR